jgi:ATP-binding cassette subfamily B multidrug efflux pump
MRIDLFKKLQVISVRFFDQSTDGDILSMFTNDIDNISNMMNQAIDQILSSLFLIIIISFAMLNVQPALGGVVLGLGIIMGIIMLISGIKSLKYVKGQQQTLGELNSNIDEKINGMSIIITNGIQRETIESFQPYNEKYRDLSIIGKTYSGMLAPVIQGFSLIVISVVIFFGVQMVVRNTIPVGILIVFVQYAALFFQPFQQIATHFNMVQLAVSGAERVKKVMKENEDIVDHKGSVNYKKLSKGIMFNNLYFSYEKEEQLLKNIKFEVEANKMLAIVGPTGGGKTTIMKLLNKFYAVDNNMIFFDDLDINNISVTSLRKNIGIVLQENVIFTGTIKENIIFGKMDATEEEMIRVAKKVNIHDYIMTLEQKYDTMADNLCSILSAGQKQLISIARTLLVDPDILILDEATSNVDTVTESNIKKSMDVIVKERTSLVIAHRLKTILQADKIIVLDSGEVVQCGTHVELLKEDGLYSELYYNQFASERVCN